MATSEERKTKLSPLDAANAARTQVAELFGKPAESIAAVARDGGRGWKVTVELVELERIPATTNILATYEVELNGDGDVVGYRRIKRYFRNAAEDS